MEYGALVCVCRDSIRCGNLRGSDGTGIYVVGYVQPVWRGFKARAGVCTPGAGLEAGRDS